MSSNIIFLESVDSTNTYAKNSFQSLDDGSLVVANEQTAGRGRLGRKWHSPAGQNFYGSAVFKHCADGFSATAVLSLAALATVAELCPDTPAFLKWPNDIYVQDRKLGGVLCEGILDSKNSFLGVVAGLGLNLNMTKQELDTIDQPATSIYSETTLNFSPIFFSQKLAFFLNMYYIIYRNNPSALFTEWKQANKLLGCKLQVIGASGVIEGIFHDIAPTGEMLLESSGKILTITSGDVKILDWQK